VSDPLPPRPPLPTPQGQVPASAPPPVPDYSAAQAAASFTEPSAYPPPHAYPAYPVAQGYAPPQGYGPPPGYAPPQGYGPPQAQPAYGGPLAAPAKGKSLGLVALVAGLLALVVPTIAVSIATYQIGLGAGQQIASAPMTVDFDWSVLAPVRDWVLLGEAAFWVGTVLGLWALIQGIVALVTDRGRGGGLAAVVLAIVAPIAFVIAFNVFIAMGLATGASIVG